MTITRPFEKGEGKAGTIIMVIIMLVVLFLAFKLVPVYVKIYAFEDAVKEIGVYQGGQRKATNDSIYDDIMKKAREMEVPLEEDRVTVDLGHKSLSIKLDYTMVVDFPGYTWKKDVAVNYAGQRFR